MTKEFALSVDRYIKNKHKVYRTMIRKILGRNIKNGKYVILGAYQK